MGLVCVCVHGMFSFGWLEAGCSNVNWCCVEVPETGNLSSVEAVGDPC